MLRSTLPLVARAVRPVALHTSSSKPAASLASSARAVRAVRARAASSAAGSSSSSPPPSAASDYDQIMRPSTSSYSSAARPSYEKVYDNYSVSVGGGRYGTADEPAGFFAEDYDACELHHVPCGRTRELRYEGEGGGGYDPSGEIGSIL